MTPVNPEISFEDVGYNSRPIWDIPDLQAEALAALGQNSDVGKEAIISTLRKRRRGGSWGQMQYLIKRQGCLALYL